MPTRPIPPAPSVRSRRGAPVPALLACALAALGPGCARTDGSALDGRPAKDIGALRIAEHRDEVIVVTFGFTSCPDVCPLALSRMKAAYRLLGPDASRVAMAFVTVDPDRDRPERLRAHVAAFDPRILPVFEEGRALADALAAWGVTAARRGVAHDRYFEVPGAASYTVDHTSGFFLVDRRGRLRMHVAYDRPAEALVDDVRRLLSERILPPVRVEAPVAYVGPSGTGAVFLRVVNPSSEADRLVAVETDAADRVEMHESVHAGDVVRMIPRPDGFAVPARGALDLERGKGHLMLVGVHPRGPRRAVPLTLRFERSGPVAVEAPVAEE